MHWLLFPPEMWQCLEKVCHAQPLGFPNEGPKKSSAALSLPTAGAQSVDLTFAAETNRNYKPKSVSLVLRTLCISFWARFFDSKISLTGICKTQSFGPLREWKDCKENTRSLLGEVWQVAFPSLSHKIYLFPRKCHSAGICLPFWICPFCTEHKHFIRMVCKSCSP